MDYLLIKVSANLEGAIAPRIVFCGCSAGAVNNGGKVLGLLFTDLSTTYNCLSHEVLIVKLHTYGFGFAACAKTHV